MKALIASLFFFTSGFAQSTVPCIAPPAPAAATANRPVGRPPGPGNTARRAPAPLSASDTSEIDKLKDLPAWALNLATGDYSHGPSFPTAPELAKRVGVPEGRVIEFVIDSSGSKFYPGVNGAIRRRVCVYVPAGYVAGTELPLIDRKSVV